MNMSNDPYAQYAAKDPYAQYAQKPKQQPQIPQQQEQGLLEQVASSWPVNATLGAGDAIRNLLSLGYTKNSPSGSGQAYEAGKILGDVGGFIGGGEVLDLGRGALEAAPYVGRAAQYLGKEGIPALVKRLSGSSLFGAAQEPEDRIKGAQEGFKAGLIGEAIGAPFRTIGGIAELANPLKKSSKLAGQIRSGYQEAQKAQKDAYAPVTEKYGDYFLTPKPKEYLGYTQDQIKYFTPEVKKVYGDFLNEPTFDNLHKLQSQMGRDASRIGNTPAKINTAQTLTAARDSANEKLSGFLKNDPEMYAKYEQGRQISRDRVFPYHANPTLKKISEGMITNPTPEQLSSAITKGAQKINRMEQGVPVSAIPGEHLLNKTLTQIERRLHGADILKSSLPFGIAALSSPAGLAGTILGGAAGHYLSPHALSLAQNPLVKQIMAGLGRTTTGLSQELYEH